MTTLVGQMPSFTYTQGPTMPFGVDLEFLATYTLGVQSGIVAKASGVQTNATQIMTPAPFTKVATVATDHDSIILPAASSPGNWYMINNAGAHILDIYAALSNPANGTTLDKIVPSGTTTGNANGTPLSINSGVSTMLVCFDLGLWKQVF